MTDIENETSDAEWQREWEAERARRNELAVGVNAYNREVLLAALRAAGVRTVIVDFNGYGDEGQIERIDAYTGVQGEGPIQFLETHVTIQVMDDWRGLQVKDQTETLESAIDTVCLEYLEQVASGWEINEGAFGDFTIDAAEKTIKLDFNKRFEDSVNYVHEF
jgi:hypothetical protein